MGLRRLAPGPAEGKTKGEEASGEALYLDNRGKDKAITFIYQREPNATTYFPVPSLPPELKTTRKSSRVRASSR